MKIRPNSALAAMALILGFASPLALAADTLAEVQALVNKGQHPQALAMADRLLAGNAKDPQARFLKGIALTELNRANEAIAVFQKLTEDFPELPEPYNNLAVLYAQQRQYDKARSALEMAIRTHPSYATAHENLGDVYARLASQAYDKALQLDSANAGAQSKLALIREMMSGTYQGSARTQVATTRSVSVPRDNAPTASSTAPGPSAAASTPPKTGATASAPAAPAAAALTAAVPTTASPAPPPSASSSAATAASAPAVKAASAAAQPSESAAAARAGDAGQREALNAVEAWAAAWSRKDIQTYLSYYDKDFKTPGGVSRKKWEQERQQRVGKPGEISVDIEKPETEVEGDVATVRFRQHYKSAGFDSSTMKTLELVKRNGKWRIREERIGG
ncbi:nuclear transport factor 2 family protein [Aromatoleum sp.]|uniref:nuclear transport factor 2 family protein n=1 Tax=Aromatoleum sp. TaxID=2307007 RepID=UPI002FC94271